MNAAELPMWIALPTALLVVVGAGLALTGSVGLLRFATFYERVHAPTLASTLGAACILLGSIVYFSALQSRPVLHELVIGAFMLVTTPITLLLLVRAVLYRNRQAGSDTSIAPDRPAPAPSDDRDDAGRSPARSTGPAAGPD